MRRNVDLVGTGNVRVVEILFYL